ncbi:hypothetical protein GCM10011403_21690 [Pseudohongiella nitratireducens]|uniref:dTDP-4-dehydrorhamnose reductase n=2 Tax=Pseudohongiella nitratireducens TaxID=1768907 RepID=A0A916QJZ3_9GAMM|nr:hypothetical protein GCM10011403_21690 [Pseudohongiella nitratireducens]
MKLMIIGADSAIGNELKQLLEERGVEWLAPDPAAVNADDPLGTARVITQAEPDQVINLASYLPDQHDAIFQAEKYPDECAAINHRLPELLAQVCDHLNIPLIHLSTAYVFGGEKKLAYNEQDAVKPEGIFGETAVAGEQAVAETAKHIILRCGWQFGPGKSQWLDRWLDELRSEEGQVTVTRGKMSPTPLEDIARVIMAISLQVDCQADVWGTYHYCALEPMRQSEFVQQMVKYAAQHDESIYRLLDHLTINLQRVEAPLVSNATLNTKRIFETFGIKQRSWHGSLQRMLKASLSKSASSAGE